MSYPHCNYSRSSPVRLVPVRQYGASPVRLVRSPVRMVRSPVRLVRSPVRMVRSPMRMCRMDGHKSEEAILIDQMAADGVVIVTAEFCGWCKKLKALGHGIEKMIRDIDSLPKDFKTSDGKPVQGFPTIDFGKGNVTSGYKEIKALFEDYKAAKGKKAVRMAHGGAMSEDDMIDEMEAAGVKAITAEWCGFCKKLKGLEHGIHKLVHDIDALPKDFKTSDGKPVQGFPTIDYGRGKVKAGYKDIKALYEDFKN